MFIQLDKKYRYVGDIKELKNDGGIVKVVSWVGNNDDAVIVEKEVKDGVDSYIVRKSSLEAK